MFSNALAKLREALARHRESGNQNIESFSCARCGANVQSLTESPHFQTGSELFFFCSERCYSRFMQYRTNTQARWAVKMLKKMQRVSA